MISFPLEKKFLWYFVFLLVLAEIKNIDEEN